MLFVLQPACTYACRESPVLSNLMGLPHLTLQDMTGPRYHLPFTSQQTPYYPGTTDLATPYTRSGGGRRQGHPIPVSTTISPLKSINFVVGWRYKAAIWSDRGGAVTYASTAATGGAGTNCFYRCPHFKQEFPTRAGALQPCRRWSDKRYIMLPPGNPPSLAPGLQHNLLGALTDRLGVSPGNLIGAAEVVRGRRAQRDVTADDIRTGCRPTSGYFRADAAHLPQREIPAGWNRVVLRAPL